MILDLIAEAVAAGARLIAACKILALSIRTIQRWREQGGGEDRRNGPKRDPPNKFSAAERKLVLKVANSPEYRDLSPRQIVPLLADKGRYVGSESTFYRVLAAEGQLSHRQASKPRCSRKPREHLATGANQLWSWDITYLRSPIRGSFYYLYLMLDVWSRRIIGAQVYDQECPDLAAELFTRSCLDNEVNPAGLVLHSDNGGPMKGSTMQVTLQRLGVIPSFSRPHVSDDNPFSEALFRTFKYRPEYPSSFASMEAASTWGDRFVQWYNTEHLHSAIRFVTPEARHTGADHAILAKRFEVYQKAQNQHPNRWSGPIRDWSHIEKVYLNPEEVLT